MMGGRGGWFVKEKGKERGVKVMSCGVGYL